jgi:hypothetical protein
MDNKITKSRLSNFFAYEWIMLIVLAVVGIIVWELVYTMTSVRLTVGQQFKYYFDETVYAVSPQNLNQIIDDELSYDVLDCGYESLTSEYNVLSTRLTVQEGDAIFTDVTLTGEEGAVKTSRANTLIDSYVFYSADELLSDAKTYLSKFLKEEYKQTVESNPSVMLDFNNLDTAKIESSFLARMKKDNRFRSQEDKQLGIKLEIERINDLITEVIFFEKVVEYDNNLAPENSIFYRYKRFDQIIATSAEDEKQQYIDAQKDLKEERYGLKMGKLKVENLSSKPNKKNIEEFVKIYTDTTSSADNVVLLTFNFLNEQQDLQFETITFMNTLIELCSDIPEIISANR